MSDLVVALDRIMEAAGVLSKRRAVASAQTGLERGMKRAFQSQARIFMAQWRRNTSAEKLFQEAGIDDLLEPLFSKAELDSLKVFQQPLEAAARSMLTAGGTAILAKLGVEGKFDLKNPRAVSYLQAHGADLVKQINETTRTDLRTVISYGVEHGWSYNKTSLAIQQRFQGYFDPGSWWNFDAPRPQGHIDSRAHLIAVTEAGEAYESGNWIVIEDLKGEGVETEKKWSTMGDDRVSEGCQRNAREGWIPADQTHDSGHMHPLRFPGCRCDELYRIRR